MAPDTDVMSVLAPPSREPDFVIGPEDNPYLLRWHLLPRGEDDSSSLYYHIFLRDDDRALHDHPRESVSVLLSGQLREIYDDGGRVAGRLLLRGGLVKRASESAHRIEVVDGPAHTLFFVGPRVRNWGFHCPNGWAPWEQFLDPENKGAVGPGCGE